MNMHALEITNLALTARREPDKIWLSKPVIQKKETLSYSAFITPCL